jgi:hypothetical protein
MAEGLSLRTSSKGILDDTEGTTSEDRDPNQRVQNIVDTTVILLDIVEELYKMK